MKENALSTMRPRSRLLRTFRGTAVPVRFNLMLPKALYEHGYLEQWISRLKVCVDSDSPGCPSCFDMITLQPSDSGKNYLIHSKNT